MTSWSTPLVLAFLATPLTFAAAITSSVDSSACTQLVSQFPDLTSFSGTTTYVEESLVNWSETCLASPLCVFEPQSAADVSAALLILEASNTTFAVRSGGHMPVPGAADIADGVLISLTRLATTELDGSTAKIGPGNRWIDVYIWLNSYGLAVSGGRFGPVGVGGLLLGGGINYFGSQMGWSANSVLNYEVVLANGEIINANASSNSDLWWALKGGSSNFGIVTRYDMTTFSISSVWGGSLAYNQTVANSYVDAIAGFVGPAGGSSDVFAAADPIMGIYPSTGEISTLAVMFYKDPVDSPAAFANFSQIPATLDTTGVRNWTDFMIEQNSSSFWDMTRRQAFYETSLKATSESVYLVNSTFFDAAVAQLSDIEGLFTSVTYQTITKNWLASAKAAGGDAIDLDPENGGFISLLISTNWADSADDQRVADFCNDVIDLINQRAEIAGLSYQYHNLNDAGPGTDVFSTFGGGSSLPVMKTTREKYDPNGVFQTLMPGGFKLGL